MRRLALIVCLLIGTVAAHAQFEKGKWFVNPSVTGLNFSYNTETDKAHFGLEVKGGAFLIDNVACCWMPALHGKAAERMSIRWVWADVTISTKLAYFWELM